MVNARGQSLLTLLVLAAALALLAASAVPAGQHMYREAVIEREAETLLANLRYLQTLDGQYNSHLTEAAWPTHPLPYLDMGQDSYILYVQGGRQALLTHRAPPGVRYQVLRNDSHLELGTERIQFHPSGRAWEIGLIFRITYGSQRRNVIITSDGRCRVAQDK